METGIDRNDFKNAVGSFVTGITVVSATSDLGPVGFTCQSFTSLSLNPPMILISVAKTSRTYLTISQCKRFCVNILGVDAEAIARDFADVEPETRFVKHPWKMNSGGNPVLEAALAWLDCDLSEAIDVEDHLIILGLVLAVGCSESSTDPLAYFRGSFGGFKKLSG